MQILILILGSYFTVALNIHCVDTSCKTCAANYYNYKSVSCLDLCPSNFAIQSFTCTENLSLELFVLLFYLVENFTQSSIGTFATPNQVSYNDLSKAGPIPIRHRGFYFESTSSLTSSVNWVLAPDFYLFALYHAFSTGVIFEISKNAISYFKIIQNPSNLEIFITLSISDSSVINSHIDSTKGIISTPAWKSIIFSSSQSLDKLTLAIDGKLITLTNYEQRLQIDGLSYKFGSTSNQGFQGFIYTSYLYNSASMPSPQYYSSLSCMLNQFIFNKKCENCTCPQTWPRCIRSECTNGYSTKCSASSGYGPTECTSCSDPSLDKCIEGRNCTSGSGFTCASCQTGFILSNGICIYPPTYNYVIKADFSTFTQYYGGVFQSGANPNTYAPYNSPEIDDPFPAKQRGLVFNQSRFLVSNSKIILNHTFSIHLWMLSGYNYYVIGRGVYLTLTTYGHFEIFLSNFEEKAYYSYPALCYYKTWLFYGLIVSYSNGATTISQICQETKLVLFTVNGYAFYHEAEDIYIGKNYYMMIYQLMIFPFAQDTINQNDYVCGSAFTTSCLSDDAFNIYTNRFNLRSYGCDSICVYGCSVWGTCNECQHVQCQYCSNFNNSCTIDTNYNPCNPGYILSADKSQCCNTLCASCWGHRPVQCSSCWAGSVLLGGQCVTECPIGFVLSSNMCIKIKALEILMNVDFTSLADNFTEGNGTLFYTGSDSDFYPYMKTSDPIPVMNRGYYFESTSYLKSKPILLTHNITFRFWIKAHAAGNLIRKENFGFDLSGVLIVSGA